MGGPLQPLPSSVGTQRPTSVRYHVLAAACAAAIIAYIHRVGFSSALPEIKKSLDIGDLGASWLTALFLIAYGIFEIPAGLLGDRFGVRKPLTAIVLGWSVLTGCVGLIAWLPRTAGLAFGALLLLRFMFGACQAGGFPLLGRMIADWMPLTERGTAQGCIWMSTRFGGLVVPHLLLMLTAYVGGWEPALWLLASLGVLWCGVFWWRFRNRPEELPQVNFAECALIAAGRGPRPSHAAVPWGRLLRSRSAWALCLMYTFGGFAANFYVTLLPTFLADHRRLSDDNVKWLSSLPFACGMVACVSSGVISDWIIRRTGNRKWGRRLNGVFGMAMGSVAWMLVNVVHEPWLLGLMLCVVFVGNDLSIGPAWAAAADIGERYAGTLGGAMNMLGSFAGALGNLVAGWLLPVAPEWVFIIYGCSFALAAACWLGVDVTKRVTEE